MEWGSSDEILIVLDEVTVELRRLEILLETTRGKADYALSKIKSTNHMLKVLAENILQLHEAQVVLLSEYHTTLKLIDDNKTLRETYQSNLRDHRKVIKDGEAKTPGLNGKIATLKKEYRSWGKLLHFPRK